MKVAWSVLAGDVRGTAGVLAASLGRSGPTIRIVGCQNQPNSPAQMANRAALSSLSQYWRTPDMNAYRAGWITLAINHLEKNVFNAYIKKTGSQWFVRCNKNRATLGLDPILQAPAFAAVGNPGSASITHDTVPSEAMTVGVLTPPTGTEAVVILATKGLSPGRLTFGNAQRIVYTQSPGSGASWDILSAYTSKLGAPVVGKQIMVIVRYIDADQGRAGLDSTGSVIW